MTNSNSSFSISIIILLSTLLAHYSEAQCPTVGDIVITEIMQNPDFVNDSDGEYFELYNTSGASIDIDSWSITDAGSDSHTISNGGPLNISAGSYLVLGINSNSGTNGGVNVDYQYSGISLTNGDDEIILTCDPSGSPTQIDSVGYDGGPNFPDPTGASMNLDPNNLNGADNDIGSNWCESTTQIGGVGDLGTPGSVNDACGSPPTISIDDITMAEGDSGTSNFTFTVNLSASAASNVAFDINTADGSATLADNDYVPIVTGNGTILAGMTTTTIDVLVNGDVNVESDEDFDVVLSNISANATILDGTGIGTINNDDTVSCPSAGDIIITEIMQNPDFVGDSNGEYFELYNTTGSSIDINGWAITDAGSDSHTISNGGPLDIVAGAYLVLGINSNSGTNGGVNVDYQYSGISLTNGDDEIILTCDPSGSPTQIDSVGYDGGPNFPDPTGASMNLDPNNLNGTDNDIGSNWCESSTEIVASGDLGTPGSTNDPCGSPPTISIDDITMAEGNSGTSNFTFTVTLSASTALDVTFIINTIDGSATVANNDYVAIVSGNGTILAGMTTTTIDVLVNGDLIVESDEDFSVLLSNISANATILDGTGTGTINNDDTVSCPNAGDIIITEIMQNPDSVGDSEGEYFEVYNTTASTIDIEAWSITDAGSDSHTISNGGPLNIAAGTYLVLGINSNIATNGGVNVDYQYSGINLSNGDDEIILTCDPSGSPTQIDSVGYDGGPNFPDPTGASMALDPNVLNGTDNDIGNNWCESTAEIVIGGDLGTPGVINDACMFLPSISIDDITMSEGDSGTSQFSFTVTLSAIDASDVTFDINTTDGSATIGDDDYLAIVSGNGIIANGTTTTSVDVTVNGDFDEELDESFSVVLSNISVNATILDGIGQGTITNDDDACPAILNLTGSEVGIADYETSDSITSDQIIEATAIIDYDAVTEITLSFPFEVKLGATFEAFIDGCNNGGGGSNFKKEDEIDKK